MIDSLLAMTLGHFLWLAIQLIALVFLWFVALGLWLSSSFNALFAGKKEPWKITIIKWGATILAVWFLRYYPI